MLQADLEVRRKELRGWIETAGAEELLERFAERFWSNRRLDLLTGGLERV